MILSLSAKLDLASGACARLVPCAAKWKLQLPLEGIHSLAAVITEIILILIACWFPLVESLQSLSDITSRIS